MLRDATLEHDVGEGLDHTEAVDQPCNQMKRYNPIRLFCWCLRGSQQSSSQTVLTQQALQYVAYRASAMATLPKLIAEVKRRFGTQTRIWLTEYGYNSKPPSKWLGVSNTAQLPLSRTTNSTKRIWPCATVTLI